ncbi:Uncharacterised protein [Escherichia coli]|uniref:Uncharacterized protein n=1 Tax=Escherichia coli TaxID=562 RepID=A0A376MHC1_ECOLX|nr:Uncharacterised protein [Escherichia coli]
MPRIMNVEDAVDGDFTQRNIDRQINKGTAKRRWVSGGFDGASAESCPPVQGGRKRPSPNLLKTLTALRSFNQHDMAFYQGQIHR